MKKLKRILISFRTDFVAISANGKGFAMCGLCAKYFQPHIAKPVLYEGGISRTTPD